jgi:hypothetical protein
MPEKTDIKKNNQFEGQLLDEEILELADEVLNTSDDEIVELTDVSDVSSDGGDEEEIIDLSEVEASNILEDEDIMDLTDTLEEPPAMTEGVTELSDIASDSPPTDEDIIDLDDFVDETPAGEEDIMDLDDMVVESPMQPSAEVAEVAAADDEEVLDLTDSDREAIADELGLDLNGGPLEETAELEASPSQADEGLSSRDEAGRLLEESVELTDRDPVADVEAANSVNAQMDESDTVELTDLDSETIDKELGDLNLDIHDSGQMESDEFTADPAALDQESVMDLDNQVVDDTVEMQDIARTSAEAPVASEPVESAPTDNLELTDADRDIIGEELNLDLDGASQAQATPFNDAPEAREEEMPLDFSAENLARDSVVSGVESKFADEDLDQRPSDQTPAAAEDSAAINDNTRDEESGLDFEKEESFADSLGMTLDSETQPSGDWDQPEEPDDIYKTQEILDEISQFDTVEDSALHKQSDPISIKVQDPSTENRLEIDSLEQDGSTDLGSISSEQLDQAVERVVKRMFAEKIESVLVQVIEKSVTKEINRIKNILLDESSTDV